MIYLIIILLLVTEIIIPLIIIVIYREYLFNVYLLLQTCVKLKKGTIVEIKYRTLTLVTLSFRTSAFENHAHLSSWSAEGWLPQGERNGKIDVQCS